jgi:hypothetical protein
VCVRGKDFYFLFFVLFPQWRGRFICQSVYEMSIQDFCFHLDRGLARASRCQVTRGEEGRLTGA